MAYMLSIRSYGDYVIARCAIKKSKRSDIGLLIGSHLTALHDVFDDALNTKIIDVSDGKVPAIFDVKARGLVASIRSLLSIRYQLAALLSKGEEVITDEFRFRQKLMIPPSVHVIPLGSASNIYIGYESLLGAFDDSHVSCAKTSSALTVGIFPESRLTKKIIPPSVINSILRQLGKFGTRVTAKLVVFDTDPLCNVPAYDVIRRTIDRNFNRLYSEICKFDVIISADSLPCHMGEMMSKPVFVCSPCDNSYWLPKSSFVAGYWDLFENLQAEASAPLDKFVQQVLTSK